MSLLITVYASSTSVIAQNYPDQILLSSVNYDDYQAPTGPIPGYLESFTEPLSGSTVTRISDKDEFGTNDQRLGNHYAKDQTFNKDGSLIKLAGYPSAILDGETFEFLFWASIPSDATWANTESDYMYGTSGNSMVKFNVYTNVRETLRTFSQYTSVRYGYGEGNISNDDKYIGLIGINGSTKDIFVYDIELDVIVGTKNISSSADLDWFSVSQLGQFAVVRWSNPGSGPTGGFKSYDIDLTNEIHLSDYPAHADLGIDIAGNEVIVSYMQLEEGPDGPYRDEGFYIKSIRLDGGGLTPLFEYPGGIWGGHISCRNIDRPGWVYISEQCCGDDHAVAPHEIFAIKLDDSGIIERYAQHHTAAWSGYNHQAKAVPNRDGTKVVFISNYHDGSLMSDPAAVAWIVEYPQESLSVEEDQLADSFNVYPNPTNDIINIKIAGSNNLITGIQLNDILGRTLVNQVVDNESTMTLDLSSYPKGMYLLSVIVDGNIQTKKIIKG